MSDTPVTDKNYVRGFEALAMRTADEDKWVRAELCEGLERKLAAALKRAEDAEQRYSDAKGEWERQKESAQILLSKYQEANKRAEDAEKDANRYREILKRAKCDNKHDGYVLSNGPYTASFAFRYWCDPDMVSSSIDEAMK